MCGIAGILGISSGGVGLEQDAAAMAAALSHRGPDDSGVWVDENAGVAFGHARLSIIDLSPMGHQPMVSGDGRYVISYNGEVYNFDGLRRELSDAGAALRGNSDTEVVLEACARWGVQEAASRFVGMFAFALWDRETRTLSLVRDRLGIKPLYWGRIGGRLAFASELKAFTHLPGWPPRIDNGALADFMRLGYVPSPRSIYEGVSKLSPGHILTVRDGGEPEVSTFWSIDDVWREGQANPFAEGDETECLEQLEDLLRDAVGRRMVADVPLGAFLSGGIDSSLVVALMQAQSDRPVKSFTIAFDQAGYDESQHAAAVAKHLGTDHHELRVTSEDARAVIPDLPGIYDEPFADSSQIPTYLVSRLTRDHVTVALSGDGGDELFAGYNRYTWGESLWRRASFLPASVRGVSGAVLAVVPERIWDRALSWLPGCPSHIGLQMARAARVLGANDEADVHRRIISLWQNSGDVVQGDFAENVAGGDGFGKTGVHGFVERMQLADAKGYLPDDILTKVDRSSMAVGLEARVPLIDHRVVEFAARLPRRMRIRDGKGKWALRQILYRHVPRDLVERPKTGFSVPLADWLRGPLREWAEDLLTMDNLNRIGLLAPEPIRAAWRDHLSGRRNRSAELWAVLMFVAWRARWIGP